MTQINDINKSVISLSGFALTAFLSNDYWRLFGFKTMPRRGKIFRMFVPKSQLAIEDFIKKELFIWSLYDVIKAIKDSNTSSDNKNIHLTGILSNLFLPFYESGLFGDDLDFLSFIKEGVSDYASGNLLDVFLKRLKRLLPNVPTKKLQTGILLFYSVNDDGFKLGLSLDRNLLSKYISSDSMQNLKVPLAPSKIETYGYFAIEILKLA